MTDVVEIKYSTTELNDLVQWSESCVTLQRKTRALYLNPVQFSNIKTGIHESLDSLLFKYDFFFKAIVLGYRKLKLLTRYGAFCYRSSKVSLQIEADFYLFNPEVGRKLQGVVCKRSGHHLSVLVHKAFTVFIPLEEQNYETGWDFAIGQEVDFEVVSLDLTSGPLPYVKGKLLKEKEDGNEKEDEGTMVGADGEGSFGNEWGGSDSGVASSTGRESEDSDDSDRNDVSEGSMKKSTIEEWTYKRPHHRKSKGSFGDELMKVMEKETISEDESGIYSSKILENSDPHGAGGTSSQELPSSPTVPKKRKSILKKKKVELLPESEISNKKVEAYNASVRGVSSSQESCSDFPSPPPVPKKRKSILKVRKDISCDTEVTNNCSAETLNTSLLTESQEESALEATLTSHSSKKRKSLLKKPKESISSVDDKADGLQEKSESTDAAKIYKSPAKSKAEMGASEIDDKSKSILKNIVRDLSPSKLRTESMKSILETLEKSESERTAVEDSIEKSKAVSQPQRRTSAVKPKEVISSSDDEDLKGSKSRATASVTSTLERRESMVVTASDEKDSNSPPEKQTDESKVGEKTGDQEKSEDSTSKKKRKSLSKSKKRTSLLYESLAEKIRETSGVTNEKFLEASETGNGSTPVPEKVDQRDGKQNNDLKSVRKSSPKVDKKKSPKKKGNSSAPEDLVTQLLKNMEKAIDGEGMDESLEMAGKINAESSSLMEGKAVNESVSLKPNVKADSAKKAGGKRKSLSKKKEEPSLSVEDMIKRLTETIQSPVAEHGIPPKPDIDKQLKPNVNPEIVKRLSLDGASKEGSKKKSRKSVSNLIPVIEEKQALSTTETFIKDDKISLPVTSTMEENGSKSISPSTLDSAESSAKTPKKQRQSMGEKKPKKEKSKDHKGTPQGEKEEACIQIEKLLMLNKKLLGLDSVDGCEDQGDKVSNEEKKSKKRKRESSGMKDSPKRRKTAESVKAEILNMVSM